MTQPKGLTQEQIDHLKEFAAAYWAVNECFRQSAEAIGLPQMIANANSVQLSQIMHLMSDEVEGHNGNGVVPRREHYIPISWCGAAIDKLREVVDR